MSRFIPWTQDALASIGGRVFVESPALEWGLVLFRIIASPVLALLVVVSRNRVPYWEIAVGFLFGTMVVNMLLVPLLRQGRYLLTAMLTNVMDLVLLLAASHLVIRGSARQGATSEMWLIYPLVIMIGTYRFRPAFSVLYTALLTGWYAAHIMAFFPPGSRPLKELPIRVCFFMLMGLLGTIMCYALRREERGRKSGKPTRSSVSTAK